MPPDSDESDNSMRMVLLETLFTLPDIEKGDTMMEAGDTEETLH